MTEIIRNRLFCAVAGALSVLGFAPFHWPVVYVLATAFLLYHVAKFEPSPSGRGLLSSIYIFYLAQFIAGLYWIGESTLVDAASWGWVWPLAVLGLPAFLALYPWAAGWLARRLGGPLWLWLAGAELARATCFTGFPWNMAGHIWIDTPFIAQNADWMGTYGLTLVTYGLCACVAGVMTGPVRLRIAHGAGGALLLLSLSLYGFMTRAPTVYDPSVFVRIVQPNIPQSKKWAQDKIAFNSIAPLTLSDPPPPHDQRTAEHWIIWPETAIASFVWDDPAYQDLWRGTLADWPAHTYVFTGLLYLSPQENANSLLLATPSGANAWRINKHHLVPFGEYIPFGDALGLSGITGITGFARGAPPRNMPRDIVPLICYEIIFPHLAQSGVNQSTRAIITVTDDSWFGNTSGPRQHLAMARWRAIENGVPVLRSANTGISAVIDSFGRTLKATEYNSFSTIDHALPARRDHLTFFGLHGHAWLWGYFALLCCIILNDRGFFLFKRISL